MSSTRTTIRRILTVLATLGSAGSCISAGYFGKLVAESTPIATGQLQLDRLPHFTELVLSVVPHYQTLGVGAGLVVVVVVGLSFLFSKNEDTRLQFVLVATAAGYTAAVQMALAIGIALIYIPAYVSGL